MVLNSKEWILCSFDILSLCIVLMKNPKVPPMTAMAWIPSGLKTYSEIPHAPVPARFHSRSWSVPVGHSGLFRKRSKTLYSGVCRVNLGLDLFGRLKVGLTNYISTIWKEFTQSVSFIYDMTNKTKACRTPSLQGSIYALPWLGSRKAAAHQAVLPWAGWTSTEPRTLLFYWIYWMPVSWFISEFWIVNKCVRKSRSDFPVSKFNSNRFLQPPVLHSRGNHGWDKVVWLNLVTLVHHRLIITLLSLWCFNSGLIHLHVHCLRKQHRKNSGKPFFANSSTENCSVPPNRFWIWSRRTCRCGSSLQGL